MALITPINKINVTEAVGLITKTGGGDDWGDAGYSSEESFADNGRITTIARCVALADLTWLYLTVGAVTTVDPTSFTNGGFGVSAETVSAPGEFVRWTIDSPGSGLDVHLVFSSVVAIEDVLPALRHEFYFHYTGETFSCQVNHPTFSEVLVSGLPYDADTVFELRRTVAGIDWLADFIVVASFAWPTADRDPLRLWVSGFANGKANNLSVGQSDPGGAVAFGLSGADTDQSLASILHGWLINGTQLLPLHAGVGVEEVNEFGNTLSVVVDGVTELAVDRFGPDIVWLKDGSTVLSRPALSIDRLIFDAALRVVGSSIGPVEMIGIVVVFRLLSWEAYRGGNMIAAGVAENPGLAVVPVAGAYECESVLCANRLVADGIANTRSVFVGDKVSQPFELQPGASLRIPVSNLRELYCRVGELPALPPPPPPPAEFWGNRTNVSVSADAFHPDGRLDRTLAGTSWGNVSAFSLLSRSRAEGMRLVWHVDDFSTLFALGLSRADSPGGDWSSIENSFIPFNLSTQWSVFDGSWHDFTYAPGDTLEMRMAVDGALTFWKNGLMVLTSARTAVAGDYHVAVQIQSVGGHVQNVELLPL